MVTHFRLLPREAETGTAAVGLLLTDAHANSPIDRGIGSLQYLTFYLLELWY